MLEQLDLDEVAEAYFNVRKPERPEYERLLIRARSEAILPILQALLTSVAASEVHIQETIKKFVPIRLYPTHVERATREWWAKVSTEREVQEAYEILQKIEQTGQPVSTRLAEVLLLARYEYRLIAALLLLMYESLDKDALERVQAAFGLFSSKYRKYRKLFELTAIILAQTGDARLNNAIEDDARSRHLTVEQWIERTKMAGLIELQKKSK